MKRAEQILVNILKQKSLTIAFAESITCGLAAYKMGTVSGTSQVLTGSIICYDEIVKKDLLKVSGKLLKQYSAESQQVTDVLATNLKKILKANMHAAVTGLASPGGSETSTKPVGTVFYSVIYKNRLHRKKLLFKGSPAEIKNKACEGLFKFIILQLRKR